MLDKVLSGIQDNTKTKEIQTQVISPGKMNIQPCQGCFNCNKEGKCVIQDAMQQLYKDLDEADIIIISSPIFFNSVSAQLKSMIDRCQAIWGSKYEAKNSIIDRDKKRLGFLLACGGSKFYEEQFVAARNVIDMFFKVTNTEQQGEIVISNTDEKDVIEREDILGKAYQAGKELISNF
jgi:multimeric flavodoxin WrbA